MPRGGCTGGPQPGGTAHLPAVPVVDMAAVLHAIEHQVPPQGLHGVVVPLAGVGEGGRRMNKVRQCEVADAWGREVAVAEGTVQERPGVHAPPQRQGRMQAVPQLFESALLQLGTSPDTWENGNSPLSLLQKQNLS